MIETTVKIDGMMCGMCESHVNDAVRRAFSVKKVSSSHAKGQTVILSEEPIAEDELVKKIGETGYRVIEITSKPYEKKGLFSFLNK